MKINLRTIGMFLMLSSFLYGGEPTNAKEAKEKARQAAAEKTERKAAIEKEYTALVAKLPAAEQAWEKVLQENLGGFYLPLHQADKVAGRSNAWDYVADKPGLPRVLLIGDSISRGYTQSVRKELAGKVNVHRAPENCGPTGNGLRKIDIWLGDGKWDLIHFNFGIHDRRTATDVYTANLEKLITRLKATGAKVVWANTTPPMDATNNEKFSPEDCDRLNAAAAEVMKRHGIATDDIFSVVKPRLAELQLESNVHFKESGYQLMGKKVGGEILKALGVEGKKEAAAPVEKDKRVQSDGKGWRFQKAVVSDASLPKVLLIGDSILNGYLGSAKVLLEGKANVDAWVNPYFQSARFNELLGKALVENGPYDVVHFNIGLHGWQPGRIKEGTFKPLTKALVEVIQKECPDADIIWASSTPVTVKGEPLKLDAEIDPVIIEHNKMAAELMEEMHVAVNDFYGMLVDKRDLARGDQFHWNAGGYKILANATADAVTKALEK